MTFREKTAGKNGKETNKYRKKRQRAVKSPDKVIEDQLKNQQTDSGRFKVFAYGRYEKTFSRIPRIIVGWNLSYTRINL